MSDFEKRVAVMQAMLNKNEYITNLGLEITEWKEDRLVGRIPVRPNIMNPYDSVHGGCLYALADIVTGTLANFQGRLVNTLNGSMNYLEPAWKTEYVYCEATLVRCGGHVITVRCELKDDNGKLLDDGSFSFYRSKLPLIPEE